MKPATYLLAGLLALCSPRTWTAAINGHRVVGRREFGNVANFSTFLLDRSSGMLYLGARDAIVAVDTVNLSKLYKIVWDVPDERRKACVAKGKTEADCNNYIRLLEFLGDGRIYACGTYAFDPQCAFVVTILVQGHPQSQSP